MPSRSNIKPRSTYVRQLIRGANPIGIAVFRLELKHKKYEVKAIVSDRVESKTPRLAVFGLDAVMSRSIVMQELRRCSDDLVSHIAEIPEDDRHTQIEDGTQIQFYFSNPRHQLPEVSLSVSCDWREDHEIVSSTYPAATAALTAERLQSAEWSDYLEEVADAIMERQQ